MMEESNSAVAWETLAVIDEILRREEFWEDGKMHVFLIQEAMRAAGFPSYYLAE
jgi:hypothetical protein